MKYIKYLILGLVMFVFTGCMQVQIPVSYNETYSLSELKNVHKINNIVVVDKMPYKKIKDIQTWRGGMVDIIASTDSNFSSNVAKEFLDQYFAKVEISNNSGVFNFGIVLEEMKTLTLNNQPSFELRFSVIASTKGNIILEKEYKGIADSPFLIEGKYGFDMKKTTAIFSNHSIQLGLHKMLEEQVKPDLLKALKENN